MSRTRLIIGLSFIALGLFVAFRDSPPVSQPPAVARKAIKVNAAFVEQLEALGYFRHLQPEQTELRKQAFLREGWNALLGGPPHRLNPADAEDLAAGGIGDFLRLVKPFLAREGVKFPEIKDEVGSAGYLLRFGDVTHVIFSQDELRRHSSGEEPGLTWGLSMARGFGMINALLKAAGSAERLYAVNGGNDLFGIFLTPELQRLIAQHPDASPPDVPYEPNERFPSFGQPEWQEALIP